MRRLASNRRPGLSAALPRVGFFGLLGSGNLGNDAAFEVALSHLKDGHPEAILDAMCMGPERLKANYGIDAVPMLWFQRYDHTSGMTAVGLKVLGKGVDIFRTASWVRQHDVVIVPGAGVLEATLPLRASGVPYAMFLLCSTAKLTGTKVALVSVGANRMNQRLTRWLFNGAARLAFYRSYRDVQSREAMRERGLDVSGDAVYPDLVFGLPTPPHGPGDPQTVGVGVMAYYGGNDDRRDAEAIYLGYVATMKRFIGWLVDSGHRVRLFWGDNKKDIDGMVVEEILADLRGRRPELDSSVVVAEPFSSPAELLREMAEVGTFVGIRYHNVVSALRMARPTISIGYSAKHDVLMADMGLADFCQSARTLDLDLLIEQFTELERRSFEVRRGLVERNQTNERRLEHQFEVLSGLLFPNGNGSPALAATGSGL